MKRLCAMLLALVMLLSLVPMTTFAQEEVLTEAPVQEALSAEAPAPAVPAEEPAEDIPPEEPVPELPAEEEIPVEEPSVENILPESPAAEEILPSVPAEEIPAEDITAEEALPAAGAADWAFPTCETCVDEDGDYHCDVCYGTMRHGCEDADGDYWCDLCKQVIGHTCVDQEGGYICYRCGQVMDHPCADTNGNGQCDVCSESIGEVYVWVMDQAVTDENAGDIFGDGTASFDPATYTLTLKKQTRYLETYTPVNCGILSEKPLKVVLHDGVNLYVKSGSQMNCGIYAPELHISGTGGLGLVVSGSAESVGIYTDELYLESARNVAVRMRDSGENSIGILAANITVAGGTLNVKPDDREPPTIGIYASGTVKIKGGEVQVCGSTAAIVGMEGIEYKKPLRLFNGTLTEDGTAIIQTGEQMVMIMDPGQVEIDLDYCDVEYYNEWFYTGSYIRPEVSISYEDRPLVEGLEYTISYSNNKAAGVGKITIKGLNNCQGTRTYTFRIYPRVVENLRVTACTATTLNIAWNRVSECDAYYIYVNGNFKERTTKTSFELTRLRPGKKYEIQVAAVAEVEDKAYGFFCEAITAIPGEDIKHAYINLQTDEVVYDGTPQTVPYTIWDSGGVKMDLGTHYTLTYENNNAIGEATMIFTGAGTYSGTVKKTFTILPGQVQNLQAEVAGSGSVVLTFDPVAGASEYWIYRDGSRKAVISDTTYTMTGLTAGTTYSFYVKAAGAGYSGQASETVKVKPVYTLNDAVLTIEDTVLVYTGKAQTPSVTVKNVYGTTLKKDRDYTLKYQNNTDIGTATVIADGMGKYSGTLTAEFTIVPAMEEAPEVNGLTATSAEVYFNDDSAALGWDSQFEIYVNGQLTQTVKAFPYTLTDLVQGNTYEITLRHGVAVAGEVYWSQLSPAASFTSYYPLTNTTVTLEAEEMVYTGDWIRPAVTVTSAEGMVLTEGEHYEVTYDDNKYVGRATVTITGLEPFSGTVKTGFTILPRTPEDLRITAYTGSTLKAEWDGVKECDDYLICLDGVPVSSTTRRYYTLQGLTAGQTYEVTVMARVRNEDGEFFSAAATIQTVPGEDIAKGDMDISLEEAVFTGAPVMPTVTVENSDGDVLTEGIHYTVSYENNTAIGEATVAVAGMGGYTGTMTETFDILPGQVQNLQAEVAGSGSVVLTFDPVVGAEEYWIYRNGSRKATVTDTTYTMTGLTAGTTYSFYVKAAGAGYSGQASETVKAKPVYTLDGATLTINDTAMTCTGKARVPSVRVKNASGSTLKKGRDYTVTCENNIEIGTATVTITGIGKYVGTLTGTYEIVPGRANTPNVTALSGVAAEVSLKALAGAQWYAIYANGEEVGRTTETACVIEGLRPNVYYKFTVRAGATVGEKEYLGSESKYDSVTLRHKMDQCAVTLSQDSFVYTGKYLRPTVTVTGYGDVLLTEGVDYKLSFSNNKNTGKAYVTVTGKGEYTGSLKVYYTILPVQVQDVYVRSTTATSVKLGWDKTSSAKYYKVYLDGVYRGRTSSNSYTISNLVAGEIHSVTVVATKTVSGVKYEGQPSEPLSIRAAAGISKYKATLEYTKADYAGAPLTPAVTLKVSGKGATLTEGVDYILRYENNDAPGKGKVVIEGIGKYNGTLTKTFSIYPGQVQNVQATAQEKTVAVSFDAVAGAEEYWVYVNGSRKAKITGTDYVITGLKAGRTYKITVKAVATDDGSTYSGDLSQAVSVKTGA